MTGGGGGEITTIFGSSVDVPLDMVPFSASSFGTGCLFELSELAQEAFFSF